MASANPIFRDGDSNNKPPYFVGGYYDFWKICMQAYLEAQGGDIWDDIENNQFVPKSVVNGVGTTKIKSSWDEDDKKKVFYDNKAKNMFYSALGMDEFFHVSYYKTSKEIWDTLEVTHEGTAEVKR